MNRKLWLIIVPLAVLFFYTLVSGTMGQKKIRVEVCMEFNGQSNCRVAVGPTRDQALRTATENACALIASGVTDTIACGNSVPKSVRTLEGEGK
ncbi:MAG: hypothetical protein FJW40_00340 [Acidobacteria bacterium]|nr:hypothetical protein [Acidobacteriota bacterium]